MKIWIIVGTRPQIIKSAPVIHECLKQDLDIETIHTGQHYDFMLSQVFLKDFDLPNPKINLEVGSGSHAYQTGEIMLRLEKHLAENMPSLVLIPGDTNSALAGALTPVKLGIPVAHIEAGARCYDMRMAEEVNRRLIDHCSKMLFAPTPNCKKNLERESVTGKVYLTGDTMYDAFLKFKGKIGICGITEKLGLSSKGYSLLTLHRAENVDDPSKLRGIIEGITKTKVNIVFPAHPRTKNRIQEYGLTFKDTNIKIVDPVSYIEILRLIKDAKFVLTDSGGLQKEALWSSTPCITIRERTEWNETIDMGVNVLAGTSSDGIAKAIRTVEVRYQDIMEKFKVNPFGDGSAAKRIVEIVKVHAEVEGP